MQFSQAGFSTGTSRISKKPTYDFPAFRVDARPQEKGKATSVWMAQDVANMLNLQFGEQGSNHLTFLTDYITEGRIFAFCSGAEGEFRFGKNQKASNKTTFARLLDALNLSDDQEHLFNCILIDDTFNGQPVIELKLHTESVEAADSAAVENEPATETVAEAPIEEVATAAEGDPWA